MCWTHHTIFDMCSNQLHTMYLQPCDSSRNSRAVVVFELQLSHGHQRLIVDAFM